jgi:two-component system, NarL family, response regulator NreC
MRCLRVVLADDHQVVREGLRAVLEATADCYVVGEEADGNKVADLVAAARPDVLLLDLIFPAISGVTIAYEVARRSPCTRIVMFSMCGDESQVRAALRAGVVGYVLKDAPSAEVLRAIRHVTEGPGRYYFSPPLAGRAFATYAMHSQARSADPAATLTPRERHVLQLVLEGHSSGGIAVRLGISVRTVESHRATLMRKLGVRSKRELFRYALRSGLLPPG